MHVKILLGRSFIDKNLSIQLGNIIVQSIIEPIRPRFESIQRKRTYSKLVKMKELFVTY